MTLNRCAVSWHEVYYADSFLELQNLEDGQFDVIITDPPYNEHVQDNQISGTDVAHNGGGIGIPHVELPFAPLEDYTFGADLVRIARRWALVFCAVEDFGEFKRAVPDAYVRGGIWYKPNAQGQMTGDRPAACYEGISILHRPGQKVWNGHGSYGLWPCNSTRGEKDRHPNQKPLDLCLKLVALFSNRGETVFDPFCGSGRIGEACKLLDRNYVGWDLPEHDEKRIIRVKEGDNWKHQTIVVREDWVKKAHERLSAVTGAYTDEKALALCKARKADILEAS